MTCGRSSVLLAISPKTLNTQQHTQAEERQINKSSVDRLAIAIAKTRTRMRLRLTGTDFLSYQHLVTDQWPHVDWWWINPVHRDRERIILKPIHMQRMCMSELSICNGWRCLAATISSKRDSAFAIASSLHNENKSHFNVLKNLSATLGM